VPQIIAWIIVISGLAGVLAFFFITLAPRTDFDGVWRYRGLFVSGWLQTTGLSLLSLIGALLVAPLWCAARQSGFAALRWLTAAGTELLRGMPFLVLVLLGYYVLADAVGLENRVVAGTILLAIYHSAYLGELLRGGLDSVSRTQWESARAAGFDERQSFYYIILPQALRRVMPGLAGQTLNLVKDSALLSAIGVMELTKQSQIVSTLTYSSFEAYLPLATGYFIITIPLALLARKWERSLSHDS
jgi:polar amino acid transport system permease protein